MGSGGESAPLVTLAAMGVRLERAAGWGYFAWSATALLAWLLIGYGPFWHRDIMIQEQQDIPLQWYEYVEILLGGLLLAAIYGCFTVIFLLNRRRRGGIPLVYAGFALVIGVISWAFGAFANMLAHMDCGNDCVAYIPDEAATTVLNQLLLVFAVAPPTLLLVLVLVGRSRRRREPGPPLTRSPDATDDVGRQEASLAQQSRTARSVGRTGVWVGLGGVLTTAAAALSFGGPGGILFPLAAVLALAGTVLGIVAVTLSFGVRRRRPPASASATGIGVGVVAALSWLWSILAYVVAITPVVYVAS